MSSAPALALEPQQPGCSSLDAADAQRALGRPREAPSLLYQCGAAARPAAPRTGAQERWQCALLDLGEPAQAVRLVRPGAQPFARGRGGCCAASVNALAPGSESRREARDLQPARAHLSQAPTSGDGAPTTSACCLAAQGRPVSGAMASLPPCAAARSRSGRRAVLPTSAVRCGAVGSRGEALALYEQAAQLDPRRADAHEAAWATRWLESRRIVACRGQPSAARSRCGPDSVPAPIWGLPLAQRVQGRAADAEGLRRAS